MKTYIEKFISIETKKIEALEEKFDKLEIEEVRKNLDLSIEKKVIEDTIIISQNLIRLYSCDERDWDNLSEVFNDFNILCRELTLTDELSYKDKTNIIFYMIKKNLSTKILKGNISVIDSREIIKHPFKTITKNELKSMILHSGFRKYFETDIELLTEKEKAQKQELEEYLHENSLNIGGLVNQHNLIKEHYFDKLDNYTEKDVEIIIEALKNLKVTEEMSNIILTVLTSKLEKHQTQKKEYIQVDKKETKKKSYNELQQELLKYYDFSKNIITSESRMSLNEIIYCVTLLEELGAHKEQLYTFIKAANQANNLYEINPINLYNEQYYKLDYYKEKLCLQTEFENLKDLYQEMFLLGGEDYEFGKTIFKEELNQYMKELPNNSDYEIEQAKTLTKARKEV